MGWSGSPSLLLVMVVSPQVVVVGRYPVADSLEGKTQYVANTNAPISSDASGVCYPLDMEQQRQISSSSIMQLSRNPSSSSSAKPNSNDEAVPHVGLLEFASDAAIERDVRANGTTRRELVYRAALAKRVHSLSVTKAHEFSTSNSSFGAMVSRYHGTRSMFIILVPLMLLLAFGLALAWAYLDHRLTFPNTHRAVSRHIDKDFASLRQLSNLQYQDLSRNLSANLRPSQRGGSNLQRGDSFRGATPRERSQGSSPCITPRTPPRGQAGVSRAASSSAPVRQSSSQEVGQRSARWMLCQDLVVPPNSECTLLLPVMNAISSSRERQVWPLLNESREQILECSVEMDRSNPQRGVSFCLKLSSPTGALFASARQIASSREHGLEVFDAGGVPNGILKKDDASSFSTEVYSFQSRKNGEKLFLDGSKRSRYIQMQTFEKEPVATVEPHGPAIGSDELSSSIITVAPCMDAGLVVLCVLGMKWLQGGETQARMDSFESPATTSTY